MQFSTVFHALLLPVLAIAAAITAELAHDYTIIFSILFLLIAVWISILPFVRASLSGWAASMRIPELVGPASGIPDVLRKVRALHVFSYAIYAATSLDAPGASFITVFLWIDWLASLAAYYAVSRPQPGQPLGISPDLRIPGSSTFSSTASQPVQHQLPLVQVTFPKVNMFLSRV